MLVASCDRCQTQYKLPLREFDDGGRQVRCRKCGLVWFQSINSAKELPDTISGSDSAEASPPDTAPVPTSILPQKSNQNKESSEFHQILAESVSSRKQAAIQELPPLTMMSQDGGGLTPDGAYVDAKPAGLNPFQFGLCIFFLMLFISLIPAFLARQAIVHAFPSSGSFFALLGFDIKAPGEGLKISQMNAEIRTVASVPTLLISGRLSNVSSEAVELPIFTVKLKNTDNQIAKDWKFRLDRPNLGAAEDMPLSLSFTDMPKDGKSIELTVAEN
jgi:predicted Zn finger-like uncharacterized protein